MKENITGGVMATVEEVVASSMSINSRLQWRFAPLSDLFLVYNDNYNTTTPFIPKVRSFNLKLTYWLNI